MKAHIGNLLRQLIMNPIANSIEGTTNSPSRSEDELSTYNIVQRIILAYRAKRQARKILRSLEEAKQIHQGEKRGKSFDDFLHEV